MVWFPTYLDNTSKMLGTHRPSCGWQCKSHICNISCFLDQESIFYKALLSALPHWGLPIILWGLEGLPTFTSFQVDKGSNYGVRVMNSGVRVLPSLTVWCGVSYWPSLGLIFSVCRMGAITVSTHESLRTVSGTVKCHQILAVMVRLPAQSSMTKHSEIGVWCQVGYSQTRCTFHFITLVLLCRGILTTWHEQRGLTEPLSPQSPHSTEQLQDRNLCSQWAVLGLQSQASLLPDWGLSSGSLALPDDFGHDKRQCCWGPGSEMEMAWAGIRRTHLLSGQTVQPPCATVSSSVRWEF